MTLRTFFSVFFYDICVKKNQKPKQTQSKTKNPKYFRTKCHYHKLFLTLIIMPGFELCWCTSMRYFYCPKSFTRSHYDEYVMLSADVLRTECFLELTVCAFSFSLPALTEMYGNSDGSVPATFQIYYMIGWKYHESQVMWSSYFLFEGTI